MLSKIFSFGNRRTGKKIHDTESGATDEIYTTRPFPTLEKEEIRVLVFKDCERKGKTLLFDSKAFATELNLQDGSLDRNSDSDCSRKACDSIASEAKGNVSPFIRPRSQHSRPSHDAKMLGEMIFGSVAMTYKGPTVKVHEIRTPHQLLLSNVFALKPRIVMPNCCDGNDYLSSSGQVDSILDESTRVDPDFVSLTSQNYSPKDGTVLGSASKPMPVPGSVPVVIEPDGDSGFTASVESSFLGEDLSSLYTSVSSCGSYHRRLHRSHVTSIDYSFGRKNEEPSEEVSPLLRRRPKLGFGIIFHLGESEEKSRALQGFFFAHFPLIESHTKRLRIAIENACFLKTRSFSSQVYDAVEAFRNNIYGLLAAPRLKEPVWLNMMTHSSYRPHLCDKFMFQLIDCLKVGNTRETNFFMASVLTAVLSYHLAWVPTVMPAGAAPSRAYLDKHSSKTLDLLAQSHPYNPLWAQLGDLYGAVGFPLKVAKTVVVGKDSALVNQVLNILSYFIRCTEVLEHVQKCHDDVLMSVDTTNGNSFEFVENSICSLCGNPYLIQECLLENSISSNGSQNHFKCKQNFEEALRTVVNKGANDKISVNEDILQELCLGLAHSSRKDGEISNSSTVEKKLQCVDDFQLICKCERNSSGFDKKELKHLFKKVNLAPRKGSHSDSFQCYCCKELSNGCALAKETTFKCYCNTNGTVPILQQMKDPHRYGGLDKCQNLKLCKHDCLTCATNIVSTNSSTNESQDISVESLERTDTSASKADSCISEEVDMDSVKCSGTLEKNEKEETVSSYGRSGSADSGIFQSPLNSPLVQRSVDYLGNDHDELDDDELPVELVLPRVVSVNCCPHPNSQFEEWKSYNNFGRSLFAGICDSYLPDLVLQGVQDKDFIMRLSSDLKMTVQHSVVDDPVSEAVCIIADTDRWTCEVATVKKNKKQQLASDPVLLQPVEVSNLVHSMLTSLTGLWDIKMTAEFCLIHLEDKLKEIYLKSKVITERVRDRRKLLSRDDLTKMLSVDDSDLPLLLAVASTHSPQNTPFMS